MQTRNTTFKSGDTKLYSAARAKLKRGIRQTKVEYKNIIDDHLHSNNPRQVWLEVQNITNYKVKAKAIDSDNVLAVCLV